MRTKVLKEEVEDIDFEELELESSDIATVQAAVDAVVAAETKGMISCSCCSELYENSVELHLHQMSAHSMEELSLALISLRGIDLQLTNFDSVKSSEEEMDHMRSLLFESAAQRSHESDGETTITVNSEKRLAWMSWTFSEASIDEEMKTLQPSVLSSDMIDSKMFTYYSEDGQYLTPLYDDYDNDPSVTSMDFNGNNIIQHIKLERSECCDFQQLSPQLQSDVNVEYHTKLQRSHHLSSGGFVLNRNMEGELQEQSSSFSSDFNSHRSNVLPRKTVSFDFQDNEPQHSHREPRGKTIKQSSFPCEALPIDIKPKRSTRGNRRKSTRIQEDQQFVCFCCGKVYKKKSHLDRHMRVHTGEKPFACTVCTKRFAIRSVLNQHIRIHTGEKPYSCSVCFQRFPQKSGLMTHMMLHNGKPFKCHHCVKSFVSNHKLRHHLKCHGYEPEPNPRVGQYRCTECYLRFFTVGALGEHRKFHAHESHNFSMSGSKSQEYVTITEEAARAAVSVIGKWDSVLENEVNYNIANRENYSELLPNQDTLIC